MTEKIRNSNHRILLFNIALPIVPIVIITLVYLVYTMYRTYPVYNQIKSSMRGWRGKVHEANKELGFAPILNSYGAETMPIGADIPMRYDKDGFRIPIEDKLNTNNVHPVVLTLGCSFTYGAATHAENTFSYLVGKSIGGSAKNGGVCSYGLAQMEIVAKKLIPLHKPDYIIVQYSPWLIDRSISQFAPTYFGKVPTPYYVGEENLKIRLPVFQSNMFELSLDGYRNSQKGFGDFISFLWNVGLPLFVHDDYNMIVFTVNNIFKLKDRPTTNRLAVIRHAYGEIFKAAKGNGARLLIVILGKDAEPLQIDANLFPSDAMIVNAQDVLLARLSICNRENYIKEYNHWRGSPPHLVDTHPNEKAHRIIAEALASKIRETVIEKPKFRQAFSYP